MSLPDCDGWGSYRQNLRDYLARTHRVVTGFTGYDPARHFTMRLRATSSSCVYLKMTLTTLNRGLRKVVTKDGQDTVNTVDCNIVFII